ncbi:MAG: serine/threonine protein phosphatase [Magnetococcales bacterium]|nr:serine/threonine protein phosphatase [Magnetococcales bacterium]
MPPEERVPFVPRIPDHTRLYAVGDIHGRADLLRTLHGLIRDDCAGLSVSVRRIIVYLGDYIDRGEDSKGVIDLLLNEPLPGFETVFLKGNHEAELQDFLVNPTGGHLWTQCGGMNTALSYQVRVAPRIVAEERMRDLRDQLLVAMPVEHQSFLASLRFRFELGDYFFTHAGVRPGLPLSQQRPPDLLWIRDPFLYYDGHFGKMVVHGHTVVAAPVVTTNRIGIDTGAYHSGHLTGLVLEGTEQRFLTT